MFTEQFFSDIFNRSVVGVGEAGEVYDKNKLEWH